MADFTTTGLITNIKRRGSLPSNNTLFDSADYVGFADEELKETLVPLIMSANEEYFVEYEDISVVANTALYDIPSRSIGMKVRDVVVLQSDGNETSIPRWSPEERSSGRSPHDFAFYFQGNQIGLFETPNSAWTLRVYYFQRRGELVAEADAAKISNIDTGTKVVTCTSVPDDIVLGTTIDIVGAVNPFKLLYKDVSVVARSGFDLTLASVANLTVGDWVCTAEETPIPRLPIEAHGLLAQAVVVRAMEAMEDVNGQKLHQKKYDRQKAALLDMITPRAEGEPKKIVSTHGIASYTQIGRF